jgi:HAD superfamily hydrolase (TIGR01509 family)
MIMNSKIRAVLFDFDGTLTMPGSLDFSAIRREISCPESEPVLEYIERLPDSEKKKQAAAVLENHERDAAEKSAPNRGAEHIIQYLKSENIYVGIVSRNSLSSIDRAMENFKTVRLADFDVVISRDTPVKPKPSGEGILMAAHHLDLAPSELLMVGDYIFDIEAGINAGASTVFLNTGAIPQGVRSDHIISDLRELKTILNLNDS